MSAAPGRSRGVGFWLGAAWIVALTALAIAIPWLPLPAPDDTDVLTAEQGPSWGHLFGTDSVGRDVFVRVLWGARISLIVGVAAILIGLAIGGTLGVLAGFRGRLTDRTVSFLFDTMLAFPAIVFAVLITSLTSRSLLSISVVLGMLAVAPLGRLARAATLAVRNEPFVLAAESLGARPARVMWRELLPNVLVPLTSFALLGCGLAIVAEGSLAFLGLSVENSTSWGTIIVDGSSGRTLRSAPHVALFPITVLFLTVLSFNWIGAVLQRRSDSRTSAF
jgi:peptide/nickel transport system permease protein